MTIDPILHAAADRARASGHFGAIELTSRQLSCAAAHAGAPTWYRLARLDAGYIVEIVTPDRWLSHSIEADLLNTGDHLEDLLEEELIELDCPLRRLDVAHFRTEDKLFTFRSALPTIPPTPEGAHAAALVLLAYEACFRRLGDVNANAPD